VIEVSIDIKPGSLPNANSINLASAGSVPVAILSSPSFDARTINPDSVSLAGAHVKLVGKSRGHCAPRRMSMVTTFWIWSVTS
jgi:hypothetical protein